ncbi:3-deoxy-7-phosphoheptulonate synthase [Nocardiopsis chromatogenes]|uniref:3-deoxy-7-phosphoheptulonate synthase n=1 Tax=Nocardiopsis chromatogenes TaxID=280239 RepID=UPI0023AA1B71|nr:3-deoxy-7-phosphoheptulonate synthase [Nocardiopsis chromatogenes]
MEKSVDDVLHETGSDTAPQQPDWAGDPFLPTARRELRARPPLVRVGDTDRLRALLARVARGDALVVLAGDCAEDPAECGARDIAAKAGLVEMLAGRMKLASRRPVVRAARIAGQFAKPRSRPTEVVAGVELESFRGHLVNGPEPDPVTRRPDPARLLGGYTAARTAMGHLGWLGSRGAADGSGPVWTAHEALLLDYELSLVRPAGDGRELLASTHWPWLGERTRDPGGRHAALLARVANPVACKVGPTASPDELVRLCAVLDPDRRPGRLTLTARMGAGTAADALPPLVAAVRRAGHPVVWMCDPMHGNTVSTPAGLKTRYVEAIVQEAAEFQAAVRGAGGVAGGLHLEATPDPVTECVWDRGRTGDVAGKYTTFCDPRLNPEQAAAVVGAWIG